MDNKQCILNEKAKGSNIALHALGAVALLILLLIILAGYIPAIPDYFGVAFTDFNLFAGNWLWLFIVLLAVGVLGVLMFMYLPKRACAPGGKKKNK